MRGRAIQVQGPLGSRLIQTTLGKVRRGKPGARPTAARPAKHGRQLAAIPHDRKPGLIAWLRSLGKDQASVRLDRHKRGQLTLTHRDANGHSDTMQVPVEIHGNPPAIAFNARYLADALEIGGTPCLSDELSPGICRHPTGRFSVFMPMRVTIPAGTNAAAEAPPTQQAAAASSLQTKPSCQSASPECLHGAPGK